MRILILESLAGKRKESKREQERERARKRDRREWRKEGESGGGGWGERERRVLEEIRKEGKKK